MKLNLLTVYTPEDSDYNRQLHRHLSSLEEENLITRWDVSMVAPGSDLQQTVTQRLKETQIVIVLLSSDFVASDDCELLEQQIFSLQPKYQYTIIPVLLRPCLYGEKYEHYTLLPDKKQAISSNAWSNPDEAFAKVAASIALTVHDTLDGKSWAPPKPPSLIQKIWKKYAWLILGITYLVFAALGIKALMSPKKHLTAKLDLRVSDLRFSFQGTQEGKLFADLPLVSEAQMSNFENVVLPLSSFTPIDEGDSSPYQPTDGRLTFKGQSNQEVSLLYLFDAKPIEWDIPEGNKLKFSKKSDRPFYMESDGAPIQGKFIFQDSLELLTENCQIWDGQTLKWETDVEAIAKSDGGTLYFSASAKSAGFFLDFGASPLEEKSIVIDSLDFTIPSDNESAPFKSTILSGSIEISGMKPIILAENSSTLIFPKLEQPGTIQQLTVLPEGIDLAIEGQFISIYQMEDSGKIINLHPPLISWLWYHHKLHFFLYTLLIILPLMIGGWILKRR